MPFPRCASLLKDALFIALLAMWNVRSARGSPALLEPLTTSLLLPGPHSHHPRPTPAEEAVEPGLFSMFQTIRSSLLRLEASLLYAPPCNATGPLAVACNASAPDAPAAPRADWLGRHHLGLRRQILSYAPPSSAPPSPTPPLGWEDATPGPDGFYDSAPDDELRGLGL